MNTREIVDMLRGLHKDANNPLATRVVMRIAAEEMELMISRVADRNREIERLRARIDELEAERAPAP